MTQESDTKTRLSLVKSVVDYIEGEDGDSIDDTSIQILLHVLASQPFKFADSQKSLPPIYAKFLEDGPDAPTKTPSEKDREALIELRRSLHDRVALALTDSTIPGQAAEGFTALLASWEAAGKPIDDQMVQLALKTVYSGKKSRAISRIQISTTQF